MREQSVKESILETMKDNKYIKEYRELLIDEHTVELDNNKSKTKKEENRKLNRECLIAHLNVMFLYTIWKEFFSPYVLTA